MDKIDYRLEIGSVESMQLEETEGVGRYDLNKILYMPESRTLRIDTGIPLTFNMDCFGCFCSTI